MRHGREQPRHDQPTERREVLQMLTIILIVLLVLLLFGGFGYRSRRGL
jgi:CRISPR/Cas system CMR-associated protein Cmr1 (group 7 of RAMP superfamily)